MHYLLFFISVSRKISYVSFDAKLGNKACSNSHFGTQSDKTSCKHIKNIMRTRQNKVHEDIKIFINTTILAKIIVDNTRVRQNWMHISTELMPKNLSPPPTPYSIMVNLVKMYFRIVLQQTTSARRGKKRDCHEM